MPGPIPGAGIFRNLYDNLSTLFFHPAFKGVLRSTLMEFRQAKGFIRSSDIQDESLGDFVSRRIGKNAADNLASAVMHGIYAGDLYKLSARSLMPLLWYLDGTEQSIADTFFRMRAARVPLHPRRLVELVNSTRSEKESFHQHLRKDQDSRFFQSSVFTFRRGLQELVKGLETYLRAHPNVKIKLNTSVEQISGFSSASAPASSHDNSNKHTSKKLRLTTRNTIQNQTSSTHSPNYIISSLSSPTMANLLAKADPRSSQAFAAHKTTVKVMVVNLFYRNPSLLPVTGFGYLIPRTIPFPQNPECALGVIFGTDATPGQDTVPGTKLTIMLGGHWWDDITSPSSLPTPSDAILQARTLLARHLNITETPILTSAKLHLNAIPQPLVGHHARLSQISTSLTSSSLSGHLKLAGAWYSGVGVNDCITGARQVVEDIRYGDDGKCGLENAASSGKGEWVTEDRESGEFYATADYRKVAKEREEEEGGGGGGGGD